MDRTYGSPSHRLVLFAGMKFGATISVEATPLRSMTLNWIYECTTENKDETGKMVIVKNLKTGR
jgi:hypothetical protein